MLYISPTSLPTLSLIWVGLTAVRAGVHCYLERSWLTLMKKLVPVTT